MMRYLRSSWMMGEMKDDASLEKKGGYELSPSLRRLKGEKDKKKLKICVGKFCRSIFDLNERDQTTFFFIFYLAHLRSSKLTG